MIWGEKGLWLWDHSIEDLDTNDAPRKGGDSNMVVIRRRYSGTVRLFNVWTRQEADDQGLTYTPWRQSQPGRWALTDDDHVAECLRLQVFTSTTGRVRKVFTFPFGRIWDSPRAVMSFVERAAVGNWSATSAKPWVEIESRRSRTKFVVKLYIRQKLSTGKVDYDALGKAYRPDQQVPAATVRRLLKQPRIKEMVDDELSKIMTAHGWSPGKVAEHFNDLIAEAKKNGDCRTYRLVLEHMTKVLDMVPAKRRSM